MRRQLFIILVLLILPLLKLSAEVGGLYHTWCTKPINSLAELMENSARESYTFDKDGTVTHSFKIIDNASFGEEEYGFGFHYTLRIHIPGTFKIKGD